MIDFYSTKNDGLDPWCRDCAKEHAQFREDQIEAIREKGVTSENVQCVFDRLKNETFDTLNVRGRGVIMSEWCAYVGIPHKGTVEQKTKRLLKWFNRQKG